MLRVLAATYSRSHNTFVLVVVPHSPVSQLCEASAQFGVRA